MPRRKVRSGGVGAWAAGRIHDGFVPGRYLIDAYGDGGFRFAEMSHRGSILALPSGIRAWEVASASEFSSLEALAPVLAEADEIDLLLLGTGRDARPGCRKICAELARRRKSAST